jgi:chaperonin GroES
VKSRIRARSWRSARASATRAAKLNAPDVKVGDRVLFGKYAGQAVKVDGEEVLVMREDDIMGVLVA